MIGTQRLFIDRKRALVELLCLGIAALKPVKLGQIVQRYGDIGMIWTERLFSYRECALEEQLSVGIAALSEIKRRQIVQRLCDIG